MKAVITGPRSGLDENLDMHFMHITVDLEELPKPGEVIILNSGSSYYVKYIMWWIDGPENSAYWSRKEDYNVEGTYQTAHVVVDYDNRRDRYGYPAGLEDGKKQGGEEFLASLRGLIDLTKRAIANGGTYDGLGLVDTWLAEQERITEERKAAEAEQERKAAEVFMRLMRKDDT